MVIGGGIYMYIIHGQGLNSPLLSEYYAYLCEGDDGSRSRQTPFLLLTEHNDG